MAAQQYLTKQAFLDQTIPGDAFTGLTDAQINQALLWASGRADSYLRKRYALPLVSWNEDLMGYVGDLAQWYLLCRRGIRPGSGNNEIAAKRHDDAVAWFEQVARGLVQIDCVDATPEVDEEGSLTASDAPLSFRNVTGKCGDE